MKPKWHKKDVKELIESLNMQKEKLDKKIKEEERRREEAIRVSSQINALEDNDQGKAAETKEESKEQDQPMGQEEVDEKETHGSAKDRIVGGSSMLSV